MASVRVIYIGIILFIMFFTHFGRRSIVGIEAQNLKHVELKKIGPKYRKFFEKFHRNIICLAVTGWDHKLLSEKTRQVIPKFLLFLCAFGYLCLLVAILSIFYILIVFKSLELCTFFLTILFIVQISITLSFDAMFSFIAWIRERKKYD